MSGKYRRWDRAVVLCTVMVSLTTARVARGQYTASFQTNTISGVVSNWPGETYYVGNGAYVGDVLWVLNSGVLFSTNGAVGSHSQSNVAVVASGGVWSNRFALHIGQFPGAKGNQFIVTNGGTAIGDNCYLGQYADGNRATVTGTNSILRSNGSLFVGYGGNSNVLTVASGGTGKGQIVIGYDSSDNAATVTGTGSVWNATGGSALIGLSSGDNNWLTITNGGLVAVSNVVIGAGTGIDNTLYLADGSLVVTNAGLTGTIVVSQPGGAYFFVDGGTVLVDRLVATNGLYSSLVFNKGTLVTHSATIKVENSFSLGGEDTPFTYIADGGIHLTTNQTLFLGGNGSQLIVTNGATVLGRDGFVDNYGPTGSVARITGPGSVWSNLLDLSIGGYTNGNQLVVTDGGAVFNDNGYLGGEPIQAIPAGANTAVVSGNNAKWVSQGDLYVGYGGSANTVTIGSGGSVIASNAYVGFAATGATGNEILAAGGALIVTNALGSGALNVEGGTLTITGGNVVVDQLNATNVTGSIQFSGGTLIARGAVVSNGTDFAIGDTGDPATYLADGGAHAFYNNFLYVGYNGANARLVVTNGATVFNYIGAVGYNASSSNNVAVIADGGVWSNQSSVYVGYFGSASQVLVTNGGKVFAQSGILGVLGVSTGNNLVLVSGSGSVWSNQLGIGVGSSSPNNQLIVTDDGKVFNGNGVLGNASSSSNNVAVITDGGVWNSSALYVGNNGAANILTIGSGGSVIASNAYVGFNSSSLSNHVNAAGGNLTVTNGAGTGTLDVRRGTLTLDGGTVTADRLVAATGPTGGIVFDSGLLDSAGASISNASEFAVGDGSSPAEYHLAGGTHSFADGLRIRASASLTGCGTINGVVVIDPNGTVLGDCGGTLELTGSVTNNGAIALRNGTTLKVDGVMVNNGLINAIYGTTDLPGGIINNGVILTATGDYDGDGQTDLAEDQAGTDPLDRASYFHVTSLNQEGNDLRITWMTGPGRTNAVYRGNTLTNINTVIFAVTNTTGTITNFLDAGALTNTPSLFYRVRLVP